LVRTVTKRAAPGAGGVVHAIVGPTAAGKTRISLELSRRLGAEIISVDSRQVYRYLDVGTDKVSPHDRKLVIHHMIDVADPDEVFTAADFVLRARDAIARIRARGKVPLLAGGSPLYYRALEGNMLSESLPSDETVRGDLDAASEELGLSFLHSALAEVDPASAARIHANDRVRIIRALEIFKLTGRTATELYAESGKMGAQCRIEYFGVTSKRAALYDAIERRASSQFRSGYPEEVRWLLDNGYSRNLPALRGFGYRELADFIHGKISLEDALAGDIKSTKAFSRRQMTWFRQFSPIIWYDVSEMSADIVVDDMERRVREGVRGSGMEDGSR
jgi:tRNA dimethylallyltransferase